MVTGKKQTNEKIKVKRYKIQHSIDEYTFPKEPYIYDETFDEKYLHVELTDERVMSIPLMWIPSLYNATDKDRKKFEISQNRRMIIWDPEKSGINDEINIVDYLGPTRTDEEEKHPLTVLASPENKSQKKKQKK